MSNIYHLSMRYASQILFMLAIMILIFVLVSSYWAYVSYQSNFANFTDDGSRLMAIGIVFETLARQVFWVVFAFGASAGLYQLDRRWEKST
ncbi:hypothetical protein [Parasphingorhabdus sp.]|uniref:hypothetical protein n=1 Tax=Parasphingorhabdus sp. TaxID=2709688 RepID=UPI003267AB98